MFTFRYWFFCFLISNCIEATAQYDSYKNYTTANGLPTNNVFAAAQGQNGIMWFGTSFGIAKFDGYKFTYFNKANGIATKAISDITYAGGDSCIFISYPNTIQSIQGTGKINTLALYKEITLQQITKHFDDFYFYDRRKGIYLLWNKKGLHQFDLNILTNSTELRINAIHSLQNNGLAFCTNKGLYIYKHNEFKLYLQNIPVYAALQCTTQYLIIITNNKIIKFSDSYKQVGDATILPNNTTILQSTITPKNTVWLRGLDKGLFSYDNNKLQIKDKEFNLVNRAINKIFIDKEENVWLCTDGMGLVLQNRSIFKKYNVDNGLINNKITQLLVNKNKVYIGTENGLNIKEGNNILTFVMPRYNIELQNVSKIFKANNNTVGINASNVTDNQNAGNLTPFQTMYYKNEQVIYAKSNNTLIQDSGIVWIANVAVLEKYQNNKLLSAYNLSSCNIRKVYDIISYKNDILVGTADGIVVLKNNNLFVINKLNDKTIGEVFQFKIDKNNVLWAASENGLLEFKNNFWNLKLQHPNKRKSYCKSIAIDDKGLLWVATWDGIFSTNGIVRNDYNNNSGLSSKTCNAIIYDSATNELIIGTDNGVNIIKKNLLITDTTFFELQIEAFVNDSFFIANKGKLNADQSSIKFYLNLPYYANNSSVTYKYRLDNGKWITTVNPNIDFLKLAAGKHVLQVIAMVNDMEVSSVPKVFEFTIKQHFYKNWWFILFIVILLQLLLVKLYSYIIKKRRQKKYERQQQQVELASLKQQAFTALMNPHFIFNALNSVQHYINQQDRLNANKYLSEFANLIRKSFDSSKNVFSSIDDELEMIKSYLKLEKMRFGQKFDYTIDCDIEVEENGYMIPTLVLQPLLENAVMHGIAPLNSNGKINVHIQVLNNVLYVCIADNGIGITKSKSLHNGMLHQSRGMQLINDRIELLSKFSDQPLTLSITEAYPLLENVGTKIEFIIPQKTVDAYMEFANKQSV